MCGIAGVISPIALEQPQIAALRRMNQALSRRGPDDEGYFIGSKVALAMRRLSIIDIAGGHQPMRDEQDQLAVVCNGEIYNYLELRDDLRRAGYSFRTNSDVETVLALYRKSGPSCMEAMRGMFAFALWDAAQEKLLLARDRFGEKPLYLHRDAAGRVWFASEMKALLAGIPGHKSLPVCPEAVHLFMVYQYVPEPRTMLSDVTKLPSGHFLELSPQMLAERAGLPESRAYWRYTEAAPLAGDAPALVRERLEQAVRLTLRSDVPVGISLSGGIDSSIIAALSRRFHGGALHAFSVGYEGRPRNDERALAQRLAQELEMPFFDVELTTRGFASAFPRLVFDMDDPIGDIAAYGYHSVSALARQHGVPVLLSGLGADELFWGYEWVRKAVRKTLTKAANTPRGWIARRLSASPSRAIFYDTQEWMRDAASATERIMTPAAAGQIASSAWTRYFESDDWGHVPLWLSDILNRTWLTSNCLALSDRVSMAHSVEARLPFLDAGLVDAVTGMRRGGLEDWKSGHKQLLIAAVRDLLPAEVLGRRKRGFTPPVNEWMETAGRRYGSLLEGGSLARRGIFRSDAARVTRSPQPAGFAYRALLLELWVRLLVDGEDPSDITQSAASRCPVKL